MSNSLLNKDGTLNASNYNQKVNKQRETFSQIDSTMAILEKLPDFVDTTMDGLNANSFMFSMSPLGFIFNIIKALGVDEETLKEWIVEILVYVLPAVEIGVKASLLANIKSLISCNTDPRIPLKLRKKISENVYTNILTGLNEDRGININVDAIDPEGMLNLSPFTEPGMYKYFGIEPEEDTSISVNGQEIKSYNNSSERVAKLVRADDMNAFIWYVIHKGNKQAPLRIDIDGGTFAYNGKTYKISNESLFGETVITPFGSDYSEFVEGTTFYTSKNPNNIAICVEAQRDFMGNIKTNRLVNVSSDWFSCNWYVDKSNYYGSNLGIKESGPRNYDEEKGIFNLRYGKRLDFEGHEIPDAPENLKFTILPKPYVLLPSLDEQKTDGGNTEAVHVQWRPIRLLFDAQGNPDQKGKFSLISESYDLQTTLKNKRNNGTYTIYDVYGIEANGVHTKGAELYVNTKTGKYFLDNVTNLASVLVECYPGLTVYEFNYDYVMGMKLFDPRVVCYNLFENAANPKYNAFFYFSLNKLKDKNLYPFLAGKQRIIEIVRTILEEDEEVNDCFFSFSNEQYDEMLRKTEEIRYRQLPYNEGYNDGTSIDFNEINKILMDYPENGTLEEQKSVIKKALDIACATVEDRENVTTLSDSSTTKIDFLTNILQQLVAAIVDAVLSPKVLMLIMINKILMGDDGEPMNTEDLMRLVKNLVKALVKEARDLIMKKLLDYILEYLTPMALQLQAKIQSEQFAAYMAIIKLLLAWFNKGVQTVTRLNAILNAILSKFKKRRGDSEDDTEIDLPSVLDDVTYADIYPSDIKDNEPIINSC